MISRLLNVKLLNVLMRQVPLFRLWFFCSTLLLLSVLYIVCRIIFYDQVFVDQVETEVETGNLKQEMSNSVSSQSWEIISVKTTDCTGYEFEVKGNFIDLLANDRTFRLELARIILQCADKMSHISCIFWECTPIFLRQVAASSCSLRFCVTRARILEGENPDFMTFLEHFQTAAPSDEVTTFPNLGGDAILISPTPKSGQNFASLATWLRETRNNEDSRDKVLEAVGKELISRIEQQQNTKSTNSIWVSTSGAGVSWLHFRIDNYPKYYTNQQYVAMRNK